MDSGNAPLLTYSTTPAPAGAPPRRSSGADGSGETLFGTVYRTQELWFTQLLHELTVLQVRLAAGDCARALSALDRSLRVLKAAVAQMEIIEPLATPRFAALCTTARFREVEAVLGQRHPWMYEHHPEENEAGRSIRAAMSRPSVFDAFLRLLVAEGYAVPYELLCRNVSAPLKPSRELQTVLVRVYQDDGMAAQLCERLTDLDECFQEWRYRHLSMVERTMDGEHAPISSHAQAFTPVFPDLWTMRSLT
ncbi:hypothetical protein [Microbispora siamensis]|uniref:Tryptophan 2,3-dioxygenase n=1 Tax=Microbispora siamensis TaxID=564413 RepID=A0ABQ4GZJ6_9ACTN|nr:hypothetical protein [Microbispora siamensis]OPG02282.1 hypothetical protein B1L11_42820 [Microbispora sp. GKU 823]GIH66838.1 tryptophan 2,3-dioxygenase [Microbispora siamensis]